MLEREYRSPGLRLVIVYGRRRVGKTYLLKRFVEGKKALFFVAIEASKHVLYRELSQALARFLGRRMGIVESIDDLLEILVEEARGEKIVVVLDEFQYLVDADPEIPSRIQRFVDTHPDAEIMLILCGSAISFFERELLGYRAPLFGRRTASMKLRPLGFLDAWRLYPRYGPREALYSYAAFGGTPAYAKLVDDGIDVFTNIARNILSPGSYLFTEAIDFLRQELREPGTYASMLSAIAEGYVKPSEIASVANVSSKTVSKYIEILEKLDIVERVRSLSRKRGEVRLEIIDPYFYFWFRYVKPRLSQLEQGYVDEVLEEVRKDYDTYVAKIVEILVRRELVHYIVSRKIVDAEMGIVGTWWYRGEEIDVVVRGESRALFIEVKWSDLDKREALSIARELEAKASVSGLQRSINTYLVVARTVEDCKPLCREGPYAALDLLKFLEKIFVEESTSTSSLS